MENTGYNDYDALNLSFEKRYANNWSGRVSYSLSKSRGTAEDQSDKNTYQKLTDLNLDAWAGPSSVDRRHVLSLNGHTEIPKTGGATLSATMRYMSGSPFTIFNSNIDVDQNGELTDPSPGRHLQRDRGRQPADDGRQEQWRSERRDWPRLLPARSSRGLARQAGKRGPHHRTVPGHVQHHQPGELQQPVGRRTAGDHLPRA
jgi:hypothetical protein